jgi:hypothetical protein
MKTFKQFILAEQSNDEINSMLKKYTSGAIEDYDNTGSFIELFDPNGRGIPKLLSNFDLTILDDDNDVYKGKGSLIKNKMTFNLAVNGETTPTKKMSVELSKTKDGSYIITYAKVL